MAKQKDSSLIADNRKARHDYFIEDTFEAGLALQGWEVKSIRAGRVQLKESYILVKNGELFLFGAHISPLSTTSTHYKTEPLRNRKLLLHRKEISHLIGSVDRKGYALIPLKLYWKAGRVKLAVALGKGKKLFDKRETIKRREWEREHQRIMKQMN